MSRRAGDDGSVGWVLQTQLHDIGEDGLHMKLSHKLLDRSTNINLLLFINGSIWCQNFQLQLKIQEDESLFEEFHDLRWDG